MNPGYWLPLRLFGAAASGEPTGLDGGDLLAIILLSLVVLFFTWLIVATVRKKLSSARGRIGEYREDDAEAARTARLWAEAKRQAEATEPEEGESQTDEGFAEPGVDIQTELLEKARERREARLKPVLPAEAETESKPIPRPAAAAPEAKPASPSALPPPSPRTLEEGLKKTREGFIHRLSRMFGQARLASEEIEEIEEILFTADIGVRTSQKLIDFLQNELGRQERADPARLLLALKGKIESMLDVEAKPVALETTRPLVILVIGVNGTGKTTSIGKLAMQYRQAGKKVVLAAADTFRAAADQQLNVWGERAGVEVVSGQSGADPGSVVYDAISAAKNQNADVVIADTAGRLHTKVNLIEELKKVQRVCAKAMEGAPHEVLLVLDATTGQNAINQAKQFHQALNVTGVILTKLDGTAKGGVIIGICDIFHIPIRYIGIGEHIDDLRPFEPASFVKALFS